MSQTGAKAGNKRHSPRSEETLGRRSFLRGGALVAGGAALGLSGRGKALAANADKLPPNVPDWSSYLGPGVDAAPYGAPSEYEGHVVRRRVEWLTATRGVFGQLYPAA